ncbi:MAG: NAD(P)/FAD-dependent oxidoreductase [Gemmatimonadota bacterium]
MTEPLQPRPAAEPAQVGGPLEADVYDLTVVGAGPTGLFALFYAGMRHMRAKVIDSLPELGGQLSALYPDKYIFDVAGFPKVLAKDLTRELVEQGLQFGATVCLEEAVVDLRYADGSGPSGNGGDPGGPDAGGVRILRLETDKAAHWTRTVLLSAGIGAFAPRKLDAEGVELLLNRGVYYGLRDKSITQGKRVLIVGGGDSAADWSVNLLDTASDITLIHRSDRFRAHEGTMRRIHESPVKLKTFTELKRVRGTEKVEGVTLVHNQTAEEEEQEADVVLLNLGFLADLGPMRHWGIEIEKKAIRVNERMETNMPGVYAAGDVVQHGGKLKLIATGFGEAAIAVNFAKHYIDPKARAFPGHSTDDKTFEGK